MMAHDSFVPFDQNERVERLDCAQRAFAGRNAGDESLRLECLDLALRFQAQSQREADLALDPGLPDAAARFHASAADVITTATLFEQFVRQSSGER